MNRGQRTREVLGARLLTVILVLIWLWLALPLALGQRTFFFRDVFTAHHHYKAFGAAELARGRIPALDPSWALGQSFRGNAATLPFYPGNVLYLLLPFWSAFNLHFVLHWLVAFLAMRALARSLGQSEGGSLCAAVTYAGSGWMLSALTFYNVLTVSAWWPLVMWAVARGDRRARAVGGIALGLALLGGGPVTVVIGSLPLALLAWRRHGWRRGSVVILWVAGLGLLIALPQVVATARVLSFSSRTAVAVDPGALTAFGFHPIRLLELIVPLPFGSPAIHGARGFKLIEAVPRIPYILSAFFGTVGLWLALAGLSRRIRWAGLAAAGLLFAGIEQVSPQALRFISGGFLRYSEKFLFWFFIAVSLLAGWGIERVRDRRWQLVGTLAGVALLVLGGTIWFVRGSFAGALELATQLATQRADIGGLPAAGSTAGSTTMATLLALLEIEGGAWARALLFGGILLLVAAVIARSPRFEAGLVLCQVLCLWQLSPLWMTDSVAAYGRDAGWLSRVEPGSQVVIADQVNPPWEPRIAYSDEVGQAALSRLRGRRLAPSPGVLYDLRYPLATELEGIYSPLTKFVVNNLGGRLWSERIKWCRALGVDYLVAAEQIEAQELELVATAARGGHQERLYRVAKPAARGWRPESVVAASGPAAAFTTMRGIADMVSTVVASASPEKQGSARLGLVDWQPDRVAVAVEGNGGLLAIRRSYHPLFEARSGEAELPIVVINGFLIGVMVPAGRHLVELEVSAIPELLAAMVAITACLGAMAVALFRRRGQALIQPPAPR